MRKIPDPVDKQPPGKEEDVWNTTKNVIRELIITPVKLSQNSVAQANTSTHCGPIFFCVGVNKTGAN